MLPAAGIASGGFFTLNTRLRDCLLEPRPFGPAAAVQLRMRFVVEDLQERIVGALAFTTDAVGEFVRVGFSPRGNTATLQHLRRRQHFDISGQRLAQHQLRGPALSLLKISQHSRVYRA
jgi:hypothetical protein